MNLLFAVRVAVIDSEEEMGLALLGDWILIWISFLYTYLEIWIIELICIFGSEGVWNGWTGWKWLICILRIGFASRLNRLTVEGIIAPMKRWKRFIWLAPGPPLDLHIVARMSVWAPWRPAPFTCCFNWWNVATLRWPIDMFAGCRSFGAPPTLNMQIFSNHANHLPGGLLAEPYRIWT